MELEWRFLLNVLLDFLEVSWLPMVQCTLYWLCFEVDDIQLPDSLQRSDSKGFIHIEDAPDPWNYRPCEGVVFLYCFLFRWTYGPSVPKKKIILNYSSKYFVQVHSFESFS